MQEALDLPTSSTTDLGIIGRLFVWTGSHITDQGRLEYLKLCIASVSEVDPEIKHIVSLSSSIDIDITTLNADVRLRDSKKRQFEHLRLIFEEEELNDDDLVMFLDDDDLLLQLPYFRDGSRSAQWLAHCNISPTADRKTVLEALSSGEWEAINDFSGYAVRVRYLRNYKWKCNDSMEDLQLMTFIDALPSVSQPMLPYIYHRMHESNGTNSEWMSGFIDEQQSAIDEIIGVAGNHVPETHTPMSFEEIGVCVWDPSALERILAGFEKLQEESRLLREQMKDSDNKWEEEQVKINEQRRYQEELAIRADQIRLNVYVK